MMIGSRQMIALWYLTCRNSFDGPNDFSLRLSFLLATGLSDISRSSLPILFPCSHLHNSCLVAFFTYPLCPNRLVPYLYLPESALPSEFSPLISFPSFQGSPFSSPIASLFITSFSHTTRKTAISNLVIQLANYTERWAIACRWEL